MKSRFLTFVLTLASMVFCVIGLSACGAPNIDDYTPQAPAVCSHKYISQVINPTCVLQGYTTHTCSKCSKSYTDNYVSATGHSFIEGDRNFYCSICGDSECEGFSFKTATYNGECCYVITNATAKAVVNGKLETPRKYESLPVRGIMSWAFSGIADDIKTLVIHDNIKDISDYLFNGTSIWDSDLDYECPIETVIFDSGCTNMRIESNAFYNCTSLKNVNITKGMVKNIPADGVFASNGGNAEYLFKDTPYFKNKATVRNGLYYVADLLLHADSNEMENTVIVYNATVAINAATFARMTFVESVTIPKTVKSIGEKAFYGCAQLDTITFEGTVEEFQSITIGPDVFSGIKAKQVQCSNGVATSYYYNGWTYKIGE